MKTFLPIVVASVCVLGPVLGCHKEPPRPQMPPMQAQAPVPDPATHPVPMEIIPLEPKKTDTSTAKVSPPPPAKPTPTPTRSERHRKTAAAKSQAQMASATVPPTNAAPSQATPPPPVAKEVGPTPTPTPTPTPPAVAAKTPAGTPSSPIGTLTEGDVPGTVQVQEETEKLIQTTERGLAGLQRPLDAQEQETAKQIKKFIEQARQALAAQDAGGAKTLAVKASLLLNELKK